MKTVKDIKVGDVFSTDRNGEKLLCTIIECRGSLFPDVLNFTARLMMIKVLFHCADCRIMIICISAVI